MTTQTKPTTEQYEAAMKYLIREIDNSNSMVDKEDLRSGLAEVAFLYIQDFPKYRTNN